MKRLRSKSTKWLINLALALTSTCLALGFLEVALRLVWHHPYFDNITLYEKHSYYKHRPIPAISGQIASPEYTYETEHSAQGLRGSALFDEEKDTTRVLFLGDSFTYGDGVHTAETFVSRIASKFPDIEIANTGAAAYDTRSEIAVLDAFGKAFQPDITFLMLFWNDLEGNLYNTFPDYRLSPEGRCTRLDSMKGWAEDPLALSEPRETQFSNKDTWRLKFLFYESVKTIRYHWLGIRQRAIRDAVQKENALTKTFELLDVAQCLADNLQSQLVVVVIPDHNQVNPKATVKNISSLNFDIQGPIAEHCEQSHIEYIDLLPDMREAFEQSGTDYFYFYDRHLNAAGHEVVAHLLADYLSKKLTL